MPTHRTRYPTAQTLPGQYRQVYEGRADTTRSGLTKKDLIVNKTGKIVSKRASRSAKSRHKPLAMWREALLEAARHLNIPYSIPTNKDSHLYILARRIYDDMKNESDDLSDDDDTESDDLESDDASNS